jgi:hypothetical protein
MIADKRWSARAVVSSEVILDMQGQWINNIIRLVRATPVGASI